jgi:hypothetical protein
MEYNEVRNEVYRVLQEGDGKFRTAYQICTKLEPALWRRLIEEYPSAPGQPPMGKGAGIYYSPAGFIAHALDYFYDRDHNSIMKAWFDSKNIVFEGIEPGFEGGWISIWAWRPLFTQYI